MNKLTRSIVIQLHNVNKLLILHKNLLNTTSRMFADGKWNITLVTLTTVAVPISPFITILFVRTTKLITIDLYRETEKNSCLI